MTEIVFTVESGEEAGGLVAHWDDPRGGGIATQGEDLSDLLRMIREAVSDYFDVSDQPRPASIRLHFVEDPSLMLA